jgi:hypothetical protein
MQEVHEMTAELDWQKSSFSSSGNNCVEVARGSDGMYIRESDNPDVVVTTTPAKLGALLKGVKADGFDRFLR